MEQLKGNFLRDQQKNPEQISYNSVDNRNEGVGNLNQRFNQDPSNYMNMNLGPADVNVTVGARPVHNYSIQTGEEFALEFMWERVNPRQQYILNPSVEANSESRPVDLHGMLGVSRIGSSERRPDASLFPSVEKGKVQDPASNPPIREDKPMGQLPQSVTKTSLKNTRVQSFRSQSSLGSSSGSSRKLKFLCSFGGTIMPRPSDRKLRYVGGETRILRINKDISWEELKQKASAMYNEPHTIKYQLPGEDLDALVSVSSDEDLQNMMEECKAFDDGGSQKLRIFLISHNDLDDSQLTLESTEGDCEIQYFVAVNGMDFGSRRNSIGVDLGNNLDDLLNSSVARENGQTAVSLAAASTIHPEVISSSQNRSSQIDLPSSSYAFEANSVGYRAHTVKTEQPEWNFSRGFHQMSIPPTADEKVTVTSSATLQYDYGFSASNHAPAVENMVQNPIIGHMGPQKAPNMGELYGSFNAKPPEPEINTDYKTVVQIKSESHKDHSPGTDVFLMDTQMNRESSISRGSDFTKVQSLDDGKTVSSDPYTVSSLSNKKSDDASGPYAAMDKGTSVMQTKVSEENLEHTKNYTSGVDIMPVRGEPEAYTKDISHEPDVFPQSLFRSERIHREQAGLNRLFKSDDSSGPQLLVTRSDVSQHIIESADKLTDRNVTANSENIGAFAKSTFVDSLAAEEKPNESSNLADSVSAAASSVYDRNESDNKADLNAVVSPIAVTYISSPMMNRGTSEYPSDESAQTSMETHQNRMKINANDGKLNDMGRGDVSSSATSQSNPHFVAGTSGHESILIDINDRFPHDFLSDIFSKARIEENSAGVTSVHDYAAGLSVNVTNHEPKHWSFFQNLARDNSRNDASLMDQDHPTFSSSQANMGEVASGNYGYPHLDGGQVTAENVDSSSNLAADNQRQSSGPVKPDAMNLPLPSDYDISQATGIQINHPMNSRTTGSIHEDEKKATQPSGFPIVDFSLGDFDPTSLQIIKNRDLEELRELGSGTYGTVYHGKWRGTDVAIKRIKKSCFIGRSSEQEKLTSEFWHEAKILSNLHHPNVVAFYGVVQDGPGGTLATVTEYMVNGSLRHALISKDRHLDRRKRLIIAMDAAFGMEYLHSRNIVHFDLKCDNLLVNLKDSSRPICKVGDFGLSKIKRNTLVTGGVRGTLPWMAPELLNGSSSKVSEKVDVFSFGIVLWEILTGEEPYANMHYGAIIGGIVNNTLRPLVPSFCDPEWRLLMEQCWAPDPLARPSFTEIARRLRIMSAACTTKTQGFAAHNQLSK
ncbi:kinase superfamily with octicosapeptide/Phox/Bem1p domain-containing protein [Perilla frutescens var. hirtella]|nr:kinase superfamily with octicosapeptide/Phox/Bem1p domain-containing protein [Perilla frutescens var. hirtella]